MTTQDFVNKLDRQLKGIERVFELAAASTHALMTQRIFVDGESETGKIGQYDSSKPLYVSPKKSPKKFPLKGKGGKTKFKNGNSHKTGYFSSYKSFRSAIGRQTSYVDLRLSGNLQRDFGSKLQKQGAFLVAGVKRKENVGKLRGIRKKYGPNVFKLQGSEKENLRKTIEFEMTKEFR